MQEKIAFIAGVGDDQGFGWAIAKSLAEQGVKLIFGTWTPILSIFETSWRMGKFDESRKLSDGSLMEIQEVLALDASFDTPEDVPEDVKSHKRYQNQEGYTVCEVAKKIQEKYGKIDIFVHALANAPEVKKPLLETSRKGYLAALSNSSYSFISMLQHLGPVMKEHGSVLTLSYLASSQTIPGYGGGMSSAKAALESDVRTLAFEAGRKWHVRVNAISAGPLASRAARAIGFIDNMIQYSKSNAPLQKDLFPEEIGHAAAFLLSDKASAITGTVLFVDNGLHTMGLAVDSPCLQKQEVPSC